ncbi:glycerophosphodiester phosphodiesterase family protein [Granulicella tundricola]|uniref:Glycerophosphoryl diester phosphodiesterase n=1 Tax=Granulicella tundricola (strain ATCC BAA-1859 / DSM 23138 / MP5ACTX9) TaxID=1198114 RepID=E8X475_GRATM|nr:glycerophosphodiester phosphodiesterase family protein [Granulicella tundricola]ADW67135.1 glycerophosphoryl diester phosphodiesterase [Granulicella tundricola MP5ACTX9]
MLKKIAGVMLMGVVSALAQTNAVRNTPRTILVHAHRGGRALRPENTIPSFQHGIDVGADVLELDLAVTKDGVLVVSHSPYLTYPVDTDVAKERVCDGPALPPGTAIHTLTLAQLKQYDCGLHPLKRFPKQMAVPHTTIPTFDEVLELAPQGTFQFNVETKIYPNHPELTPAPEAFVKMIDDAVKRRHLQARVILQSFDFRTLHAMRAIDPAIRLSALFEAKDDGFTGIADQDKSFAHIAKVSGAEILSPDQTLVTPEAVATAHAMGRQVAPFTVNTSEGWQKMADAKVDAIISDDPVALLAWLRAQNPPLHP